jgi:hypothetical protein
VRHRRRLHYASTSGSGSSTGGVAIKASYFDSPGADDGSNSSLNAERVQLKNTTGTEETLTGWTLDDAGHIYTFPSFSLAAGSHVKIHNGAGGNTTSNLYWRLSGYIWNNTRDAAAIKDLTGTTVDRCSYTAPVDRGPVRNFVSGGHLNDQPDRVDERPAAQGHPQPRPVPE